MKWYYKNTAGHETHSQGVVIDEENGETVALVYKGDVHGKLMASAPKLVEALQRELQLCPWGPAGDCRCERCRRIRDALSNIGSTL